MRMEDTQRMDKFLKIDDIIAFDVKSLEHFVYQEVAAPFLGLEKSQNKFIFVYKAILQGEK